MFIHWFKIGFDMLSLQQQQLGGILIRVVDQDATTSNDIQDRWILIRFQIVRW